MNEKKKILHLITGLDLGGGAENMLLQLLPRIQGELENRVCVLKGRGEIGRKLENLGITVYYLELKNVFDWGVIGRYRKVVKEFKPGVQVNYLIHADIFGRIFGRLCGVKKIVAYIRNIHRTRKGLLLLDRLTVPLVNSLLTNSQAAKRFYIHNMGVREENIQCLPNSVDLSRFDNVRMAREDKLKELVIPQGSFIIGSVARLEKQKDIPTLIKAFQLVLKENDNVHLLIVGHGKEKEQTIELIEKLEISAAVTLVEKRTDMPEIYKIMDIFVLPSLNEGMSNALLEAMASAMPVITSNIEENMELVKDGEDGLNFSAGDPIDLAKQILVLMKNENGLANRLKKNGRTKIEKEYELRRNAERLEKYLINLIR